MKLKSLMGACALMSLFNISISFANPVKDSIDIGFKIVEQKLNKNLDSLYASWIVQQGLKDSVFVDDIATDSLLVLEDDSIISVPGSDSLYIERLSLIESPMKISYNKIVGNFIRAYTTKHSKKVEAMLGISEYYFPIFEEALDKKQMPLELKYLPVIESALNPRAVSRAGATGLWQFMYGTGKFCKLNITSYIDERRDPIKSTYAAIQYLDDLYKIYGDWMLVIAAYNCGPGNVNKAIRRANGRRDYWDIYYFLPRETRGYVPSFIAAMYTFEYYKEHNLTPSKIEWPILTDTLMINQDVHFRQISDIIGVPLEQIRDLNPQYRRDFIPAKNKDYPLCLPYNYSGKFIDSEDSIYSHQREKYHSSAFTQVDPKSRSRFLLDPPAGHVAVKYTVKQGDYLGYISEWFNVGVSELRHWNRLRGNIIRVGQKLTIYVPAKKAAHYSKYNNMTFAQKQKSDSKTVSTPVEKTAKGNVIYYTVKKGDTLWDISRLYPGVTIASIVESNNLGSSKKIKPGQKLRIKVGS